MKIWLMHLASGRLKPGELGLLDRFDLLRIHLEDRLVSRYRGNCGRKVVRCKQQRGVFITRQSARGRVLIRFIVALVRRSLMMVLRQVLLVRPLATVGGLPCTRGECASGRGLAVVIVRGMSTRSMHGGLLT